MARHARLDSPEVLHHVMARGIEKRDLFWTDADKHDFMSRLEKLTLNSGCEIYAWTLMPNHFHILLRAGVKSISRLMQSLLTGYALKFNHRHQRCGHLFQNRFKSIVVEDNPYFLELVRYIHLNPIRAGLIADILVLEKYPFCGHSAILGQVVRQWQATRHVLEMFGKTKEIAIKKYRMFMRDGLQQGHRKDLEGGGVVRVPDGCVGVMTLERGRERFTADERVLGSKKFISGIVHSEDVYAREVRRRGTHVSSRVLIARIAKDHGINPVSVIGHGKTKKVAWVRALIAYVWTRHLGRSGHEIAQEMGVSAQAVSVGAEKIHRSYKLDPADMERWAAPDQ